MLVSVLPFFAFQLPEVSSFRHHMLPPTHAASLHAQSNMAKYFRPGGFETVSPNKPTLFEVVCLRYDDRKLTQEGYFSVGNETHIAEETSSPQGLRWSQCGLQGTEGWPSHVTLTALPGII